MKSRSKQAFKNMIIGLLYEAILAISGILIPRFIILQYGSAVNGMIGSITQFLSIIALLKGGVGGVTRAALYKPLSIGDKDQIDSILKATQNFMNKIALIFSFGVMLLALTYYWIIGDSHYSWSYCFSMVIILGIGTFSQYFFGMTSQLLLQADQKNYVWCIFQSISTLLNIIVTLFLVFTNQSIHLVKIGTAIIYSISPILLSMYVMRKYGINKQVQPNNHSINERWKAFSYQIATYIHENTDVVLLTFFSTLSEVSVYNIYSLVINSCVRRVIETSFSGFDPAIGDMWARGEKDNLNKIMIIYEYLSFTLSALLFSCTSVLILSFMKVYTSGVHDINYQRPLFSFVLIMAELLFCFRMPYYSIITALGKYKETAFGAVLEALINISVSVLLIWKLGILGVAIGTFVAMLFRLIYMMSFTHNKILKRDFCKLLKFILISLFQFIIIFSFSYFIPSFGETTIFNWGLYAITIFSAGVLTWVVLSLVFAQKEFVFVLKKIKRILFKTAIN